MFISVLSVCEYSEIGLNSEQTWHTVLTNRERAGKWHCSKLIRTLRAA